MNRVEKELMEAQHLLNVFIYDHSQAHRLALEKIIKNYVENNSNVLKSTVSITSAHKISHLPLARSGLYFLNIDDLEKEMDGIIFALNIRNNDLYGSIVFLTEYDIFATGRSDLAIRSLDSHVTAMTFLAKDSTQYEKEIKECIAIHIRKISMLTD